MFAELILQCFPNGVYRSKECELSQALNRVFMLCLLEQRAMKLQQGFLPFMFNCKVTRQIRNKSCCKTCLAWRNYSLVGEPHSTRHAPHCMGSRKKWFVSGKCFLFCSKFCKHGDDPTPWATPAYCRRFLQVQQGVPKLGLWG